jgi:hypothetical protein
MAPMANSRWHVSQLGVYRAVRPRSVHWRSHDLREPLPTRVVRALETAIKSLPARGPWPEIDEEAWWADVLADRRLRRSAAKMLPEEGAAANQRLDRLPTKSLTFSCRWCGASTTLTVTELIRMFGAERNVATVGREVLPRRQTRAARG